MNGIFRSLLGRKQPAKPNTTNTNEFSLELNNKSVNGYLKRIDRDLSNAQINKEYYTLNGVKKSIQTYNYDKVCRNDYRNKIPFKLNITNPPSTLRCQKKIIQYCKIFYDAIQNSKEIKSNTVFDVTMDTIFDYFKYTRTELDVQLLKEIVVNYYMYQHFKYKNLKDVFRMFKRNMTKYNSISSKIIKILKEYNEQINIAYPEFGKILEEELQSIEQNKKNKENKAELNRQIALEKSKKAQEDKERKELISYIEDIPKKYNTTQKEYIGTLTRRIAFFKTLNEQKLRELYAGNANISGKLQVIEDYTKKYDEILHKLSTNNRGNVRRNNSGNVRRNNSVNGTNNTEFNKYF
jgi:predicted Holliday junction resolvase-like endonuclease